VAGRCPGDLKVTGNPIHPRGYVLRSSRIQFGMHNSASGEDEPRHIYQEKEVPAGFWTRKEFPDLVESVSVTPFLPDASRLFPTTPCENKNPRDRPVRREREVARTGHEGT